MKQETKLWLTIGGFIIAIGVLSLIDLGLNVLGLIPGVGDVVKTASETIIELIQVCLAGVGLTVVALMKR